MAVGTVMLNALDNVMPRYFASFILTFALKPGNSFKEVNDMLQRSLDQVCETIPILRSRIFPVAAADQDWRLEARSTNLPGPQVALNDLSSTCPDYEEIVESGLWQDVRDSERVVPKFDVGSLLTVEGTPAFLAQANYVNGGLLLTMSFFHPVLDGMGVMLLIKLWAQNARGVQAVHDPSQPIITIGPDAQDRAVLDRIWKEEKHRANLVSDIWSPTQRRLICLLPVNPPEEPIVSATEEPEPVVMASHIFYISAESLKALNWKCTETSVSQNTPTSKVTVNDAIMALIWQCTIRARAKAAAGGPNGSDYDLHKMTHLNTTLDGRALIAELPWNYMGTLIYIVTTSMAIKDLLSFDFGLQLAARNIRHSVTSFTRQKALEAYGVAAGLKDYGPDSLRYIFSTMRGSDVCISSISSLTPSELSFGRKFFFNAGHPDLVRPPLLEYGSVCRRVVVMPLQPSGGIEILIEIPREEMDLLKADPVFGEYAEACG